MLTSTENIQGAQILAQATGIHHPRIVPVARAVGSLTLANPWTTIRKNQPRKTPEDQLRGIFYHL